jgi:hypothetical protein
LSEQHFYQFLVDFCFILQSSCTCITSSWWYESTSSCKIDFGFTRRPFFYIEGPSSHRHTFRSFSLFWIVMFTFCKYQRSYQTPSKPWYGGGSWKCAQEKIRRRLANFQIIIDFLQCHCLSIFSKYFMLISDVVVLKNVAMTIPYSLYQRWKKWCIQPFTNYSFRSNKYINLILRINCL